MKRLLGVVLILVGIGGMALSIVGGLYVWRASKWLNRNVPPHLESVELSLISLSTQLQAARSRLEGMDARLGEVQSALEQLARSRDDRAMPAALREALEKNIVAPLRNLEELTISTQQTMHSLSNALLVLDTVPLFSMGNAARGTDGKRPLQSVAASLEETAQLLQQILQMVPKMRSVEQLSPQQLSAALDALATARSQFEGIRIQAGALASTLDQVQSQVESGSDRTVQWLNWGAAIALSICIGYACSQLCVLLQGWQIASPKDEG